MVQRRRIAGYACGSPCRPAAFCVAPDERSGWSRSERMFWRGSRVRVVADQRNLCGCSGQETSTRVARDIEGLLAYDERVSYIRARLRLKTMQHQGSGTVATDAPLGDGFGAGAPGRVGPFWARRFRLSSSARCGGDEPCMMQAPWPYPSRVRVRVARWRIARSDGQPARWLPRFRLR